jgi:monoterpene epsilon-lactone hydrolase
MASPELQTLIDAKRADPYTPEKTLADLRGANAAAGAAIALPEGTICTQVDADGVNAEWIVAPNAETDKTFMFIHGGGYYRGSAASSRSPAAHISAATGAQVFSIDYRLAPENPFPGAVEDALTAYRWMLAQGADPARTMVGGVSAGGGLTLALLLKLKETGDPLPAGAAPMSAWVDMTQSGESFVTKAEADPTISKIYLDRMAGYYLNGADPKTPLASPLFGDLSGLPPLLMQVGTAETLMDDSRVFAERAKAAGVDVIYEAWDDLIHGWHGSAHVLPEARDAIAHIGDFYNRVIG